MTHTVKAHIKLSNLKQMNKINILSYQDRRSQPHKKSAVRRFGGLHWTRTSDPYSVKVML